MFFKFEADFIQSLRCIPMVVRYNLDTCGVKLTLAHWHQLSYEQREYLATAKCQTWAETNHYRETLQRWLIALTGKPANSLPIADFPDWLNGEHIPDTVHKAYQEKAGRSILSLEAWQQLTPLQRFALIKLSRPGHENRNFVFALKEFGLDRS
ncbi:MAG: hypothetical protein RLZZ568_1623 [Cyanobacteriota bacterium]|jgi:hypothetical protein